MSDAPRLVLASASPRRRELLAQVGIACEVRPTDVPELERPGETPRDYVARVAREKLLAALEATPRGAVLAADTVVALGDSLLQKPRDEADALAMLARLEGRAHEVHTAVALGVDGSVREVVVVCTTVHFRALGAETRARYVALGEGRDKAGGYGIQGVAGAFVERIDGSYSNVVGLPLAQTAELLIRHGIVASVP